MIAQSSHSGDPANIGLSLHFAVIYLDSGCKVRYPEITFPVGNASVDDPRIKAAVAAERNRIKPKTTKDPDTEMGKKLKAETDLPTSVVNRKVRAQAREILKNTKIKGKPN